MMLIKSKNNVLTLIFLVGFCHIGLSSSDPDDDPVPYHPYQFFIQIDESVSESEKNSMLADLNSVEIWEEEDINLALWQVISFPYVDDNGNTIFDIDGTIAGAKSKTEIEGATFNINHYITHDQLGTPSVTNESFNHNFSVGEHEVIISILDTGISDIADNSNSDYNFNLTTYTGYDYVNNE